MALKDWKQEKWAWDVISWRNKDNKRGVVVSRGLIAKNVWFITIVPHSAMKHMNRRFQSRNEVLKFAKQYMRTH